MAMTRIYCPTCGWTTNVHYNSIYCIKEKERDHFFGLTERGYDAHDSAFGMMCPKCGMKAKEETRYFTKEEIEKIKQKREENG